MNTKNNENQNRYWPKLKTFPMPTKALISGVILTMALAMAGALGQIIVHDIIPTFFSSSPMEHRGNKSMPDMEQTAEDTAENHQG